MKRIRSQLGEPKPNADFAGAGGDGDIDEHPSYAQIPRFYKMQYNREDKGGAAGLLDSVSESGPLTLTLG